VTALKFGMKGALAFIEKAGIALEGAKGPYPNTVEALVGEPIRGNWWSHPKANYVYNLLLRVKESPEILVTRLYKGKITFVHRRLWSYLPAVVERVSPEAAVVVDERHLPNGRHEVVERPITRVLSERGITRQGPPSEELAQLFEPITSSARKPRTRSGSR
jgi:hypothetical protein